MIRVVKNDLRHKWSSTDMISIENLSITSAPWTVSSEKDVIAGKEYVDIESNHDNPDNPLALGVLQKDAGIIAAAPELYVSEYNLVEIVERMLKGLAGICDIPEHDDIVLAIASSKAALKKAMSS